MRATRRARAATVASCDRVASSWVPKIRIVLSSKASSVVLIPEPVGLPLVPERPAKRTPGCAHLGRALLDVHDLPREDPHARSREIHETNPAAPPAVQRCLDVPRHRRAHIPGAALGAHQEVFAPGLRLARLGPLLKSVHRNLL